IVLERLQEVEALLQAERGDRALEAIRDALLEMQREAPEAAENLEWLIAELEVRLERSVEPDPGLETERPGLGEWLASTLKEGQSLDELRRRLASLPSRYPDEAKVERAEVIRLLEDIPDLLEQGYTLPEILERLDRSGSNVPFEK
ncbi:MAG: hypothetical protein ACRDXD_05240, partial [Acidimicrobiia bacterium]